MNNDPQIFYPDPDNPPEEPKTMNAEQFLSRGIKIKSQLESRQMQLASLQSQAERMTTWIQETHVKHSQNLTSMQDTVHRIMEAKEKLEAEIIRMHCIQTEISLVIGQVEDPIHQKILNEHYLEEIPWKEITTERGNSESYVMKTRKKALGEVQKILDDASFEKKQPVYRKKQ